MKIVFQIYRQWTIHDFPTDILWFVPMKIEDQTHMLNFFKTNY